MTITIAAVVERLTKTATRTASPLVAGLVRDVFGGSPSPRRQVHRVPHQLHLNARQLLLTLSLLLCLPAASALADDEPLITTVADPFLEMHSGPGRGYPIFHVVEKGETVEILKSRTDWFKVRVHKDIEGRERIGWVPRRQLGRTLSPSGEVLDLEHARFGDFQNSRWELGFSAGDFEGASALSAQAGYRLTENLTAELQVTQAIGNFSDNTLASINIQNQPFPQWRVSPYFSIGAGLIKTEPSATLVQTEDRTDNALNVGVGLRAYLTRNMVLRAEFRNHVILTSRDQNEEVKEWKVGLSIFY